MPVLAGNRATPRLGWPGLLAGTLALAACPPSPSPADTSSPPADTSSPPADTSSPLRATDARPTATAPADASSPSASAGPSGHAAPTASSAYSLEGIAPLGASCRDPRAVLGQAAEGDRRLADRIRQAVGRHPDFEEVSGKPEKGRQISLWEAGYGGKNFSIETAGKGSRAVIARCANGDLCRELAAMIRAEVGGKPSLICGEPPAVSGGMVPLRNPDKARGAALP